MISTRSINDNLQWFSSRPDFNSIENYLFPDCDVDWKIFISKSILCLIIDNCNCAQNVAFESGGEFGCGVRKIKSNLSSNPRRKNFQSNEKNSNSGQSFDACETVIVWKRGGCFLKIDRCWLVGTPQW